MPGERAELCREGARGCSAAHTRALLTSAVPAVARAGINDNGDVGGKAVAGDER